MRSLSRRGQVVVVGLGTLGAVIGWLIGRPSADIPNRFRFVCVASGETFDLTVEEAAMIPARHPETGQYTLILCTRGEDGAWRAAEETRGILEDQLAGVNRWVDPRTLQIRAPQ
jgi:hypothetical protein